MSRLSVDVSLHGSFSELRYGVDWLPIGRFIGARVDVGRRIKSQCSELRPSFRHRSRLPWKVNKEVDFS